MCVSGAHTGLKRVLDLWELEIQIIVNHSVGVGNFNCQATAPSLEFAFSSYRIPVPIYGECGELMLFLIYLTSIIHLAFVLV